MDTEAPRTKVNLSTTRNFAASFGSHLKETFFSDDPFRQFKGLPACGKAWNALKYFVPVFGWAPTYTFAKFRYDLLAGITIASLAIPQGISYARLANLPPIIGLCKIFHFFFFCKKIKKGKNKQIKPYRRDEILLTFSYLLFLPVCRF